MFKQESIKIGNQNIKVCCASFKSCAKLNPDERGICFGMSEFSDADPVLLIQSRSIAKSDEAQLKTQAPVSILQSIGIQCCPWCGKRIKYFR
jgi:hypothetical protein